MKKYLFSFAIFAAMLFAVGYGIASAQTTYTIQPGDNLISIAARYGTSVQAIADANGLVNPHAIFAGQSLVIPDQSFTQAFAPQPEQTEQLQYLVQPGDTLIAIALRYGKDVAEIAFSNGIYYPYTLYPGQVINIPNAYAAPAPAPVEAAPSLGFASPGTATITYDTHTVGYGDTLFDIARFYGVGIDDLMSVNDIANPNYIYVNQVLNIPGTETYSVAEAPIVEVEVDAGATVSTTEPTPYPEGPWPTQTPTPLPVGPWPTATPSAPGAGENAGESGATADPTPLPEGPWPTQTPTPLPVGPWPTSTPAGDAGGDSGAAPEAGEPVAVEPAAPAEVPLTAGNPVGANLFVNGGFEGGHYNQNDLAELQIPNTWRLEWKEGESGFDQPFFRPEVRVLSKPFIPPHEHEQFFYDGNHTVKVFKGYAPIDFSLVTDVALEAGVYEMTVNVFPDLVVEYTDAGKVFSASPSAGDLRFIAGAENSDWLFPTFGERNEVKWRFRVTESGTVSLGANLRGRYGLLNNGYFMDNWSLFKVE